MMTPEQVQRTIEFILSSQAESAVRMDRIEESQKRTEQNLFRLSEENERFSASLRDQKERLDVLVSVTHDLLQVSKIHNERLKRLESKGKKSAE